MKHRTRIPDEWESYTFLKSDRAWFCVYSGGVVTRTWTKSLDEEAVSVYISKGKAQFKAAQKSYILKHVVAAAFIPGYKKGDNVVCKDGNERNCSVENLELISKKELGKRTGHLAGKSTEVIITEPYGYKYACRSVRAAAKRLNCSYQTVLDYMGGKVKRSVLDGYKIDRRYD